jgi:hypothetical protein
MKALLTTVQRPHRSKTTLISNGIFCLLESKILSIGQTLLYSLAEMLHFYSEISLQLLKLLSIKKREILEKSRQNKIFIISGFNGGHRNDKKSPGLPFMLEIPMSDPLVYSQTTVYCGVIEQRLWFKSPL